jgi:L-ascorbate metabolism protein UlaG (beta-lactamase superfamily)
MLVTSHRSECLGLLQPEQKDAQGLPSSRDYRSVNEPCPNQVSTDSLLLVPHSSSDYILGPEAGEVPQYWRVPTVIATEDVLSTHDPDADRVDISYSTLKLVQAYHSQEEHVRASFRVGKVLISFVTIFKRRCVLRRSFKLYAPHSTSQRPPCHICGLQQGLKALYCAGIIFHSPMSSFHRHVHVWTQVCSTRGLPSKRSRCHETQNTTRQEAQTSSINFLKVVEKPTEMATKPTLTIDLSKKLPPTRDGPQNLHTLPVAKSTQTHPSSTSTDSTNASLLFVGTATTILSWEGITVMTDPNFLHEGDHVHLGPGVTGTRKTNPAVDLDDLPHIDLVLLSHYHADHFDQKVEESLRRDLPIITTPHAKQHLSSKSDGEAFTAVRGLDVWDDMYINATPSSSINVDEDPQSSFLTSSSAKRQPMMHITGMPGEHVDGILGTANTILQAIPPTNGWMLELGYSFSSSTPSETFKSGYRIYISGDTLYVDSLKTIPELYTNGGKDIDLMLIHLGGTTIPGPGLPVLMVTMDAVQGVKLVRLVRPKTTIPIHYESVYPYLSPFVFR